MCTTCFGTRKIVKPFRSHLLSNHPANCPCDCGTCSEKKCRPEAMDTNWLQTHFLCTKAQLLHGSEHNYYSWECLQLKCEKCFLNKPSVLLCERSAFDDPSVIMKWEKWDTMDYSRRNLVGPGPLPLDPQQQQGIPLRFAPEAPKLKKTWVKKSGPITHYFKDFALQLAEQFIHTQLDKLTSEIHRRVVTGVDAETKRLVLHCDFSQDLAHAMADQSMCEYFDIISSSLFISVAHFWDPVTNKRECEGMLFVDIFAICLDVQVNLFILFLSHFGRLGVHL